MLLDYIEKGIVRRYVDPRWNSRADRMEEAVKKIEAMEDTAKNLKDKRILENALLIMGPILEFLNTAQKDDSNWEDVHRLFCRTKEEQAELGHTAVAQAFDKYKGWMRNVVTNSIAIINADPYAIELTELEMTEVKNWTANFSQKIAQMIEERYLEVLMAADTSKLREPANTLRVFKQCILFLETQFGSISICCIQICPLIVATMRMNRIQICPYFKPTVILIRCSV